MSREQFASSGAERRRGPAPAPAPLASPAAAKAATGRAATLIPPLLSPARPILFLFFGRTNSAMWRLGASLPRQFISLRSFAGAPLSNWQAGAVLNVEGRAEETPGGPPEDLPPPSFNKRYRSCGTLNEE